MKISKKNLEKLIVEEATKVLSEELPGRKGRTLWTQEEIAWMFDTWKRLDRIEKVLGINQEGPKDTLKEATEGDPNKLKRELEVMRGITYIARLVRIMDNRQEEILRHVKKG